MVTANTVLAIGASFSHCMNRMVLVRARCKKCDMANGIYSMLAVVHIALL